MKSLRNILLILTDQQRLDTISAYGLNHICRTPNIDSLAERGTRFDYAFTPIALCSPARASLFTGLYPHRHGVISNSCLLREDVRGISEYLGDYEYRCGYAGKWHVDENKGPTDFGFLGKDFLGYAFPGSKLMPGLKFDLAPKNPVNPYEMYLKERGIPIPTVSHGFMGNNPTNQDQEMYALHEGSVESSIPYFVAEETIRLMDEFANSERPFFLWTNFWGPHTPCLVPEPYFSMYNPDDIPEYPSYKESFENKPYTHKLSERFWGLGDYGWRGFQEITARYYGYCTLIDDMIGRMLDHLERLGVLENTVVIFTTDHGDCMGAHKLIEKGEFMYEEIYHIPLVVAHPACQRPGSVDQNFVYLHDISASVLDMAGIEVPAEFDGMSFLPAVLGQPFDNRREEVYCEMNKHFMPVDQRMIRTRTHQLTFNPSDVGELYDLMKDPYQLHNVYGSPAYDDVRQDLLSRMGRYMQELDDDPGYNWFRRVLGVY